MSLPFIFLWVLGSWISIVVATTTLYDIRMIQQEKALRRHPYARRWRRKPLIHMQYARENELSKTTLRDAKHQLQYRPRTRFVETIPQVQFPQTTRQFFAAYKLFALMPFIKVRSVFNALPLAPAWPMVVRQSTNVDWRDYTYLMAAWLFAIFGSLLLCYVGYIAIIADQPVYFATYVGLFYAWLSWSIVTHPWLTVWQKISYVLLVPASLGYFLWRAVSVPLRPLWLIRLRRQNAMIDI